MPEKISKDTKKPSSSLTWVNLHIQRIEYNLPHGSEASGPPSVSIWRLL
jgi:hypothetical protein